MLRVYTGSVSAGLFLSKYNLAYKSGWEERVVNQYEVSIV